MRLVSIKQHSLTGRSPMTPRYGLVNGKFRKLRTHNMLGPKQSSLPRAECNMVAVQPGIQDYFRQLKCKRVDGCVTAHSAYPGKPGNGNCRSLIYVILKAWIVKSKSRCFFRDPGHVFLVRDVYPVWRPAASAATLPYIGYLLHTYLGYFILVISLPDDQISPSSTLIAQRIAQ